MKTAAIFRMLVAVMLLTFAGAIAAKQASNMVPCAANAEGESERLDGFLIVHVACSNVHLEIPESMQGRAILLYTEFSSLSTGASEFAPGSAVDSRVVLWKRVGSKMALQTIQFHEMAGNSAALQRGVKSVSLPTVIDVFDVIRESADGAPVIDITSLFTTNVPKGFALEFKRHYGMAQVDGRRSVVQSVRAFPQNIQVGYYQTWVPDDRDLLKPPPDEEPPKPTLGFSFKTNFLLLPEKPMAIRCEDERVGYFSVPFSDYGSDTEHRAIRKGAITRYRLEKKHPDAAVSEPVQPIVFYLSREIPAKWRPYIKQAIEQWRGPLEQAGFRDAIHARDAPTEAEDPEWDPGDLRHSVIRWAPGSFENALGPNVVDPRSGEVISSHTLVWHDVLRLVELWYFTQVSPLDPRASKLPLPSDLEGELLRYVLGHEIGHALGLRHNFKGHSAYSVQQLRSREFTLKHGNSASIMDYSRFNYVAQPGDGAYLLPVIGAYDHFAIEWGYRPLPGKDSCDDEWPELDRMAAKQIDDPALRFGGENDAGSVDPSVNTQVLGSDPIESTDMGLRNIDRVAAMLIPATSNKGRPYYQLTEVYEVLLAKRQKELSSVAKLVGGVEETRYHAGRGTVPFRPVSGERQRRAVKFLLERGFTRPDALVDPELLWRMAPYGATSTLQEGNRDLLGQLIDPYVFRRMSEAATFPAKGASYRSIDMLIDLNDGLFKELGRQRPVIDFYRRDVQRSYVRLLMAALSSDSVPGEYRLAVRTGVSDLQARLEKAAGKVQDRQTRAHLADLKAALDGN